MKESDLNKKAMDHVAAGCPHHVTYKLADRFTSGIPDTVFTWNNYSSWLEFKLLDPNESIHKQLDPAQLVELVKLERASGRAWIVAFRRANVKKLQKPQTVFYSPHSLLRGQVPLSREISLHVNVLRDLKVFGVAWFDSFDYAALAALIHQTHEDY
jgi:hypothetical protein